MIDTSKKLSPSFYVAMEHHCQAKRMAQQNGIFPNEKTIPMLVGGYIDAYFAGSLDLFIEKNPQIFKKDGTLYADYKQANEIIDIISNDELFMEYMSGEKQVYVEGEICGVPYAGYIDSLHTDKIVDLKILESISKAQWTKIDGRNTKINIIQYQGIDKQMAIYRELVYQQTGNWLPCYIAAATKEKYIDKEIIHIDDVILDIAMEEIEEKSPMYWEVRYGGLEPKRCGVCDYCRSTKKLVAPVSLKDIQNNL